MSTVVGKKRTLTFISSSVEFETIFSLAPAVVAAAAAASATAADADAVDRSIETFETTLAASDVRTYVHEFSSYRVSQMSAHSEFMVKLQHLYMAEVVFRKIKYVKKVFHI